MYTHVGHSFEIRNVGRLTIDIEGISMSMVDINTRI